MRDPVIWINVSTSFHWSRPPVGIVRTEQSICSELEVLYGAKLRKCIWVDNEFQDLASFSQKEPTEFENEIIPDTGIKRNFWRLLPLFVKKALKKGFTFAKYAMRRPALTKDSEITVNKIKSIPGDQIFRSGDVLISLGLDWDYPYYKSFYYLRKELNIKIITCCYDLIPVLYPQYCVGEVANLFSSYFLDVADGSDCILCISKQSQKDLQAFLESSGGAVPSMAVIRLGDGLKLTGGGISHEIRNLCDEQFILYVSSIERRKNHEVLYKAYHLLAAAGQADILPKLVFVGMPGWGVGDLLKDIELDPLTKGKIIQLHHVTDDELNFLYESALFCVFPSLYEGWGLPVSEALSRGKLVVSSDRGSLPEVGDMFAEFCNPWRPDQWAEKFIALLENKKIIETKEAHVKNSYKTVSWRETAEQVRLEIDKLLSTETVS